MAIQNVKLKVKIDRAKLERMKVKFSLEATRNVAMAGRRKARTIITQEGRKDTGEMWNGVQVEQVGRTGHRLVSKADHSIFQEKGVKPFSAKPGKVLVFKDHKTQTLVFTKKVKGFDGIHFMERAMKSLKARDAFTRG